MKKSTTVKKSTSTKKSLASVITDHNDATHAGHTVIHSDEKTSFDSKPVVSTTTADAHTTVPIKKTIKPLTVKASMNTTTVSNTIVDNDSKPLLIIKKYILSTDINPDKYFILCDGKVIRNCKELADILQLMSDDMFKYHVTETKNDFANWINDVFNDSDLAKKIRVDKDRLDTSIEIYKHVLELLEKSM